MDMVRARPEAWGSVAALATAFLLTVGAWAQDEAEACASLAMEGTRMQEEPHAAEATNGAPLARGFAYPPQESKPWVYWWFQGGYGDAAGMARDLAEMRDKGIGGVMHMQTINVSGMQVAQEPRMLTPGWDAWFGEALRLAHDAGLAMSASIVDGWGHGGWWVDEEAGAKQLVYTETQVEGPGPVSVTLPQPQTRLGVYRDVAVAAFPERFPRPPAPLTARANNVLGEYCGEENWPAAHALDGDPETYWRTATPCSPEAPAQLDLEYSAPLTVSAVFVAGRPGAGPAEGEVQVSDDGSAYRTVVQFAMAPGEHLRAAFAPTTAQRFRLVVTRAHADDLRLAEFALLREGDKPLLRPGVKHWELKSANRGWWGWPPNPYEALEEAYPDDGLSDTASTEATDLTSLLQPDGRLEWQVPEGRWTVLRFGWTPLAEPARMGSGGYEVDVLSLSGADLMIENAAKRMRALSLAHAGGAPIVFHTDSWEIGAGGKGQQPTWTADFREQFRQRRGYDLLAFLPVMARRIVDDRATTERFLQDFRTTVADLLAAYYARLQEHAHELHGAVNPESGYGSYPHPHLDGLQVFGRADLPMAEFWHPFGQYAAEYLQWVDIMRTAASGARTYGHRIVQAETLTYHPTAGQFTPPAQYRRTLHEAWVRGLNQAVIHKYTHQPGEVKPGWQDYDILNRHFAWWPLAEGFLGYMGRCQFLLQQGEFVADAAYFVGQGSMRYVPGKAYLRPELPPGYDYDGVNAEALLSRASVEDGRLALPGGLRYRYLVLSEPQCRTLSPDVLARIRDLVEAGLTLVGTPPLSAPGLADRAGADASVSALAAALWGASPGREGERAVGAGRVIWGRTMAAVLAADGVQPDVEASEGAEEAQIEWIHRRADGEDIYFMANPLDRPVDLAVALRSGSGTAELYDPLDGSIRTLPDRARAQDGRLTLPLRFEPEQAYFVVLRGSVQSTGPKPDANFPAMEPVITVAGPWEVQFDAPWVKPLPPGADGYDRVVVEFAELADWTERPEPGIRAYSGVARYRAMFDMPALVGRAPGCWFIDLGVVKEMARVTLNGRDLGVAWCPPWRVRVPEGMLRDSTNEAVIEVANTWHNRLCADAALPAAERLTQVGHGLHEQAAIAGLQPAGLIGPVRVVRTR